MAYIKIAWNDKSATFSCVSYYFCFVLWSRLAGWSAETYEKCSFFSIFSCLVSFPQVFGQVKEWSVLKLHKIIRVSQVVAFPIASVLFFDQRCQGGVFKVMKKVFLVFLAFWILFPKFLVRLRSALFYNCMKW